MVDVSLSLFFCGATVCFHPRAFIQLLIFGPENKSSEAQVGVCMAFGVVLNVVYDLLFLPPLLQGMKACAEHQLSIVVFGS